MAIDIKATGGGSLTLSRTTHLFGVGTGDARTRIVNTFVFSRTTETAVFTALGSGTKIFHTFALDTTFATLTGDAGTGIGLTLPVETLLVLGTTDICTDRHTLAVDRSAELS